jgi:hypothetical protein
MRRQALAPVAIAAALAAPLAAGEALPAIGWIEPVQIENTSLTIDAKVDTGADFSSLDARGIRIFRRAGEEWVSFQTIGRDGKRVRLERSVYRYTTIKRAGGAEQKRATVLLGVCLGSVYRVVQVNLVDRGTLEYRMLVGRDFLQGRYLVDPARTFVTAPSCPEAP